MLKGSALVDSGCMLKPRTQGQSLKLRTNSIDDSDILVKSGSSIDGDVQVGPEGDPDEVIYLESGSSITGETSAAGEQLTFPSVSPPTGLANQGSLTVNGNTMNIFQSGVYDKIELKSGGKLKINGDLIVYVTDDMMITSGSSLIVKDDCSLTLYIGGKLGIESNSIAKEVNLRPQKLQIYGTPGSSEIGIKSNSIAYAAVYASNAMGIIDSGCQLTGVFSGGSLVVKSNSALNYEEAVKRYCLYGGGDIEIERWWEDE